MIIETGSTLLLALALGIPAALIYAGFSSAGFFFARATGARVQFYGLATAVAVGLGAALVLDWTHATDTDALGLGLKFGPIFVTYLLTVLPGFRIEGRAGWRDDGGGFLDWFVAFLPLVAAFQLGFTVLEFASA